MKIEIVEKRDLNVINLFLSKMGMNHLSETSFSFPFRKVYKIRSSDRIVAIICYIIVASEIELEAIYVEQEFRNLGYGNKLMDQMIEDALLLNCEKIFLEVRPSNKEAIDLYFAKGFNIISTRKEYYGDEDGLVMKKEVR